MKGISLMFLFSSLGIAQLEQLLNNRGITSFSEQYIHKYSGRIKTLNLANNKLTDSSTLKGLSEYLKLRVLYLGGNKIESLGRSLYNCTNLIQLDLSHNRITNIEFVFAKNNALKILDVRWNRLTSINANSFSNLVNLEFLNVVWNRIKTIEIGVFANTRELRILHLDHNKLTLLQASLFVNLINLKVLILDDNKIKTIEIGVFAITRALKHLSIKDNKLTLLQASLFVNLLYLGELHLGANRIKTIEIGSFANTQELRILHLDHNKLTLLQASLFVNLLNLEELRLGANEIKTIEIGVFANQRALMYLYLQNNRLRVILWSTFGKTPNLTELHSNNTKNLISKVEECAREQCDAFELIWTLQFPGISNLETLNCILSCTQTNELSSDHLFQPNLRNKKSSKIPDGIQVSMKSNGIVILSDKKIKSPPKDIIDDDVYIAEIKLRLEGKANCVCPAVLNSTAKYQDYKYIYHPCIKSVTPEFNIVTYYTFQSYLKQCTGCDHC